MKILVVDDESLVSDCISRLLSFDGHEVKTANSGEEALEIIGYENFDLVLTDYAMPGIKGDELALAIRALSPDQPIIMITGNSPPFKSLPYVDFIVNKPVMLEDLRRAIDRMLRERSCRA